MIRYDAVIIGGGPAGLNAALILARANRRIIVFDLGRPRNSCSESLHGFLTRDGINPKELLAIGKVELQRYGVEIRVTEITSAKNLCTVPSRFLVTYEDKEIETRKLLIATGIQDKLPSIEGFSQFYGRSIHHCPYCDGWEYRNKRLISYGKGEDCVGLALTLKGWSNDIVACSDGTALSTEGKAKLEANEIDFKEEKILKLEGKDSKVERINFEGGDHLQCNAIFFNTEKSQTSDLAVMLGCEKKKGEQVKTGEKQRTNVSGLYLAGDADGDVQFAIVAAAEGATAAVAINKELREEDQS